jgi:hypothetical protein
LCPSKREDLSDIVKEWGYGGNETTYIENEDERIKA